MEQDLARFKQYLSQRYPDRSTTKHYMSDLGIFSQFVGEQPPRAISLKTIDAFVQEQSQQQYKPSTINRRLAAISSFFAFLIAEAEDDSWPNPVRWSRHSVRGGRHLPRDVADETVTRLLEAIADERDQAIFSLMVKAGLRVGEVVTLNVADLEPPSLDSLARLRVRGKGDKERVVWLTAETWRVVQQWRQIRPESDSQALFLNRRQRRLSVSGVQYRLKQYCQKIEVDLSCHQLRHTFARRLAERSMPIESLAKLLGHNDLQTTQGYIDGADPTVRADFLKAIQALDQLPTQKEAAVLPPGSSFGPAQSDPRPDPATVLAKLSHLGADLPPWLWSELSQHILRRMASWTPHQVLKRARSHLGTLCRMGGWLVAHRQWVSLAQLQRVDVVAYVNSRQAEGLKPSSISAELSLFRAFWRDLLDQELVTNGAVLQVKAPAGSDHLPRYLTGEQFQRLEQVIQSESQGQRHRDWFNRAWFYLLAHGGLRISEALNLRLSDVDFSQHRLLIRSGKGDRDRVIPMTPHLVTVLQDYLKVRETARTDHLLLFQGDPVDGKLVHRRLGKFGQQAGLENVYPHRLRHTLATLLINQGMPLESLQKFLGHQHLNQTLIYARVHDETVRQQFAAAMAQIETIAVANWPTAAAEPVDPLPGQDKPSLAERL